MGLLTDLYADHCLLNRHRSNAIKRVGVSLLNRGFQALLVYRVAHALRRVGVPGVPDLLTRMVQMTLGIDIDPSAALGPGVVVVHGVGLVIGSAVRIEGDCVLFHGVTLGDRGSEWVGDNIPDGHPRVERDCMIGTGAKLLGPITIGANSVVGANAVVTRDVEPNSVMAGVPARRISERPVMDKNLRPIGGHRRAAR